MASIPRSLSVLAVVVVLAAASACQPAHQFQGQEVEAPAPAVLTGTNWNGEEFELGDTRGQVAIVSFGYTYCPDVCPFTLAKMKQLYGELGPAADEVAVVFASVDPHRDSVEKLSNYVPNFDERFYGVRMDFDQIDAAKESFGLAVQYGQPKDGPGTDSFYYVDHTGSYFVFDRAGALRVRFPPNATVAEILPDVEYLLSEEG